MDAIVVVDRNWAIGRNGGLLFSLPSDMKRFRALTLGGVVLMGRKTLESFPGGKPLPGRRNIVLTSRGMAVEGAEVVHTLKDLCRAGETAEHAFVIGGGSVYAAALSRCRRVYLTRVDAVAQEPDTYFPNLDKLPGWEVEHAGETITENGLTYRFVDYVNRSPEGTERPARP